MNQHPHIEISTVPIGRITPDVVAKTDLILKYIAVTTDIRKSDEQLATLLNCSSRIIRNYKSELRKIFSIPDRASIHHLANHPQIHAAIHSILVRDERSDKLQLRGAKGLYVVANSGELLTVENYLLFLYRNPDAPAALHCYTSLLGRLKNKMVVKEDGTAATMSDMPSDVAVVRWLRKQKQRDVNIKLGRMREHDVITKELGYVTRKPEDYAAGEHWFGDHTEHPFELYNEETKRIEHWWVTAWIDLRSGLLVGYHNSPRPNSETIALAYRNAVLGTQMKAAVDDGNGGTIYKDVHIANTPSEITIDRGKDYMSGDTKRVFGKIDFSDQARAAIQHQHTKLNYAMPYHAQTKGMIEVWFRTYQRILKYLPSFRGSNYSKKPDSHKSDMKEGNILTVATYLKLFELAVNAYNNRIRRRLQKQSPLQYYLTHYTMQRSVDIRVLDFLMMRSRERVIERSQIRLFNTEYYSDRLVEFNHKKADVYYDPMELGYVSVYVNGDFIAVASNKELIGQTERGWIKFMNDRKNVLKGIRTMHKETKIGLSGIDAKYDLLAGQLMNVSPVSAELMNKQVPEMFLHTGIEEQAKETRTAIDQKKQITEIEKEAKKKYKNKRLTLAMIDKL